MPDVISHKTGVTPTTATGGETTMPFNFYVPEATDLGVDKIDVNGTKTTMTQGAGAGQYSVPAGSLKLDAGGTINLVTAAVATEKYIVYLDARVKRPSNYPSKATISSDAVNGEQNREIVISRQLLDGLNRTLQFPIDDPVAAKLPNISTLLGKYLYVDTATSTVIGNSGTVANALGIPYDPGRTGSVTWNVQDKLRESVSIKDFGAVGDGTTDDTAAIQAAVATGLPIFIPPTDNYYKTTATINVATAGQAVYGVGDKSYVKNEGTTANSTNTFTLTADRICVDSIRVTPADETGILNGNGILADNADHCRITNCAAHNYRSGGIKLYFSDHCIISNNVVYDSLGSIAGTNDHTEEGSAIGIRYSGSYNVIDSNTVKNTGTGINLQSINAADRIEFNVVSNNALFDLGAYGILLYELDVSGTVIHTVVQGNTIETVTGAVGVQASPVGQQYIFGAGIYVQGAEHTIVDGNMIKNTNVNTEFEQLAPGAIGVTNCNNVNVTNNHISDATWYGIHVNDGNNLGVTDGGIIVSNNNIFDTDKAGIDFKNTTSSIITGNHVGGCTSGIFADIGTSSPQDADEFVVSNNVLINSTAGAGITVKDGDVAVLTGNISRGNSTHGIVANNIEKAVIVGNACVGNTTYGISVDANTDDGIISGNYCSGNNYNINVQSTLRIGDNALVNAGASDYLASSQQPYSAFADGDTTPSVKYGRTFVASNTSATSITAFDDGEKGQIISFRAGNANTTVVNAGSLQLAGSTNFVMGGGDTLSLMCSSGSGSGASNWLEIGRMER